MLQFRLQVPAVLISLLGMENIKGKVVVITGSSSGIGEAIAVKLAGLGAKVVLGARRADRLESLVHRIHNEGGEAVSLITNVKESKDLNNLVALAVEKFGRLDVMINNAGVAYLSRIDALETANWMEMIDVNLKGTLYGIAAAMPVFKAQGSGHIINIISTSGIKIVPLQGVYAATKNAVRTLSEAMRQESGGKYRVTGISPGMVKTEFVDHMVKDESGAAMKARLDEIAIHPQNIAAAVVYAIQQPDGVDVGEIVIRPTVQD